MNKRIWLDLRTFIPQMGKQIVALLMEVNKKWMKAFRRVAIFDFERINESKLQGNRSFI